MRKILITVWFGLMFALGACGSDSGSGGGSGGSAGVSDDKLRVIVGRGYDISDRYADSTRIKKTVLDFDKMKQAGVIVRDSNLRSATFETVEGATVREYQNELAVKTSVSAKAGIAGASFESEVGASFGMTRAQNSSYAFATSTSRIVKDAYFVEYRTDPAKLRQYLSASFLSDLETKTPAAIISEYGTEVMLGCVWGARLDYHFSARKKGDSSTYSIGAYAKAKAEVSLQGITAGGGTSSEVDTKYSSSFETTDISIKTVAVGGLPELARSVQDKQEYDAWINSIDGNEVWSDYYPNSLVPIYEFIDNTTDKDLYDALKAAYETYLQGKVINVSSGKTDATTNEQFIVQGEARRVSGGDDDIDSQNNNDTEYTITVELSTVNNDSSIQAKITYTVTELKGDNTKLRLGENPERPEQGVKVIGVNKSNVAINLYPMTWTHTGRVRGEVHGFITPNPYPPIPFLHDLQISIDGRGDDEDNIGIKGYLKIPYSY